MARAAEALGYHSLWVFQRLLYPLRPREPYYGSAGGPWPEAFRAVLDPVVALTVAAAVTTRIRLGVSVLITPLYSPVVLGKQLASLDVVSGGRLEVGLGTGWSSDESVAAGAPAGSRGARAEEFLRCLIAVWGDDPVEFAGRFFTVPRSLVAPKPVQRPRPPLLIGGYSPGALARAARYADGYTGGNVPLQTLGPLLGRLREAAAAAGRDPAGLRVVCRAAFNLTPARLGAGRRLWWGTADEIREDLDRYAAAGVTETFLDPNFQPGGPDPERVLEQMAVLAPAG